MTQTAIPFPTDEFPSLKRLILADPTFHLPSRLAWLMTDASAASGLSYMSWSTMIEATGASNDELRRALRTITETWKKWKLFEWNKKEHAYRCLYERGEAARDFKARVQQTVNVKLGIAWVLRDLLETRDGYNAQPAPHSCKEFADQLDCNEKSVSRVMSAVLARRYFRRYQRRGAPLYTRFNDELVNAYEAKYRADPRTEDADGVNPKVVELFPRGNKSRSRGVTNPDSRGNKSRSGEVLLYIQPSLLRRRSKQQHATRRIRVGSRERTSERDKKQEAILASVRFREPLRIISSWEAGERNDA